MSFQRIITVFVGILALISFVVYKPHDIWALGTFIACLYIYSIETRYDL